MNVPSPNTNEATSCVTFNTEQTGQAWGGIQPPQDNGVCPCCGACKHCGWGGHYTAPYTAPYWPGCPRPYVGDWPYTSPTTDTGTITCGQYDSTGELMVYNAGLDAASAQMP